MSRPRVRVLKNTRTEIHQDRRLKRQRTRAADERHNLEDFFDDFGDCDGSCRAGRYCIQHADPVPDFIEP